MDGATATLMEARTGINVGLSSFLWCAAFLKKDPSLVYQIHSDYLTAGADIILTATYKANTTGFAEIGVP